ncbi:MAG: hypothetical protein RMH97_02595, partial [Verrucomicrobiales bacterium]|nr:hypothetical protein [Verrucomicrobiales bacterium]
QRIRMLEPHWDGKFVKTARPAPSGARGITPVFKPATEPAAPGPRRPGTTPPARARIQPESFLPALGNPTVDHIKYAAEWQASLPPTIEEAVRSPLGASAVIYALLLSPNEPVRNLQLEQLRKVAPQEAFAETVRLRAHVEKAARNGKLPIVDFALAGLRGLSPRQFIEFKQAIKTLIEADDEIDLFEFVLQKIVIRHLEPHFTSARRRPIQFYSIKPLLPDCAVLLSALAHLGHPDVAAARAAFELGWPHLRVNTPGFELLPHSECTLDKIDSALNRLSEAVPHIKKLLLDAAAHTVSADGMINDNEAELLRAIADALDCPVPPFIQGVQPSA